MKILREFACGGRTIRFTNFVDEKSFAFERLAKEVLPEAAMEQQLMYLSRTPREHYLLQISDAHKMPTMQICAYVGKSRWMPGFAMVTVPNLGQGVSPEEEAFALKILAELLEKAPGVMTLRVQSQRYSAESLYEFQKCAEGEGYFHTEAMGPVRTLILDFLDAPEKLLATFSQKTRSKLRHVSREKVRVMEIATPELMQVCENAMNESRKRSGGGKTDYDFKAAFALAKAHPESAKVLGLFLEANPHRPLAYVIGFCSGRRSEYASAGAFGDPELRAIPYNYFLMWELINWARSQGAKRMDLGGVTDGGPNDPLQGIARFKRSLTTNELEIGREMMRIVRPVRFAFYCTLKTILSGFRWKNPVSLKLNGQPKTIRMMPTYD